MVLTLAQDLVLQTDPYSGGVWTVLRILLWLSFLGLAGLTVYGAYKRWLNSKWWFGWLVGVMLTLLALIVMDQTRLGSSGEARFAMALSMVVFMVWLFFVLRALCLLILKLPWSPLAVARTVMIEAIQNKLVVVFLFALLFVVMFFVPLVMTDDNLVRYQVQFYLRWSLTATAVILGVMTICLSCSTLSSEMRDKQIYMSAVKPIPRGTYLLGKWIGISVLNALLLTLTGLMIFVYTMGVLAQQPGADWYDEVALKNQVLTARESVRPEPPTMNDEQAERWLAGFVQANEQRQRLIAMLGGKNVVQARIVEEGELETQALTLLSEQYFRDQLAIDERGGPRFYLNHLRQQVLTNWWSIPPNMTVPRRFIIEGLGDAKVRLEKMSADAVAAEDRVAVGVGRLQLEYKLKAGLPDGTQIPVNWGLNGRFYKTINAPAGITQVLPIPADAISADGVLEVNLMNQSGTSFTFPPKDGMFVLYPASGFSSNFVRGLAMIYLKLAFLGMLGLVCATFLGFPVALLLSSLVFFGSLMSNFVLESMVSLQRGDDYSLYQNSIMMIGWFFAEAVQKLSEFNPQALIAEGRVVTWGALRSALFWIGVIWTGLLGLLGWWIFQKREIAKVQV